MHKIIKSVLLKVLILNIAFPFRLTCQQIQVFRPDNGIVISYSDTTFVSDSIGQCIHIKKISKTNDIDNRMNFQSELLNDMYNKHTRLIYKSKSDSFNIPTVPLSHLYILREKGVILGLSSYENSPYNILVYSFSGNLLIKRSLNPVALNLSKNDMKYLIRIYPRFKTFLLTETPFVLKTKDSFYVEASHKMINYFITRKRYDKKNIFIKSLVPCRYFSERFITSSNQADYIDIDNQTFYHYKSHSKFFNLQRPFLDLIMDKNIPYVLILKDYKNDTINIPLISNCDPTWRCYRLLLAPI